MNQPICPHKMMRGDDMAIDNVEIIDMIAESKNGNELVLGITDYLGWESEYEHLMMLQEKINTYLMFIETKQYNVVYPNKNYESILLEICFAYDISENCEKFLDYVLNYANDQLSPILIKITAEITE